MGKAAVKIAGDPIFGIADEYADQIDYMTSIDGEARTMKNLSKFKEGIRESYYGMGQKELEKLFGDITDRTVTPEKVEAQTCPSSPVFAKQLRRHTQPLENKKIVSATVNVSPIRRRRESVLDNSGVLLETQTVDGM